MTFVVALVFNIKNQSISPSANGQCGRHFFSCDSSELLKVERQTLPKKEFYCRNGELDVNSKFL